MWRGVWEPCIWPLAITLLLGCLACLSKRVEWRKTLLGQ